MFINGIITATSHFSPHQQLKKGHNYVFDWSHRPLLEPEVAKLFKWTPMLSLCLRQVGNISWKRWASHFSRAGTFSSWFWRLSTRLSRSIVFRFCNDLSIVGTPTTDFSSRGKSQKFVSVGKLEDLLLEKQLIKCFCWAGRALTAEKSFYNSLKVRRLIVRPSISIKVVARNYFGHLVKLDTHLSEGLCHFYEKDNS